MRHRIDTPRRVRHHRITMKTATVRDLRNHFADVAKWIEHGEQVSITRNGEAFATLSPAPSAQALKPFSERWAARMKRFKPVGKGLTKAQTEKFWSDLRD